uniref:Proteasome 20S subunit beta 1 n=1 Tax=Gopherus agassizii TaxID=38772 RepID=A0A452GVB4_9SAUR
MLNEELLYFISKRGEWLAYRELKSTKGTGFHETVLCSSNHLGVWLLKIRYQSMSEAANFIHIDIHTCSNTCTSLHKDTVSYTHKMHACTHLPTQRRFFIHFSATPAVDNILLSTVLYSRRFFPYYVYNIIGGLDEEEEKGAVYSFDPVDSYQRDAFKAGGSASAMLQPLLDNQVGFKNMQNVEHVPLSLEKAIQLVKDVFISAAERDVYTGDALKISIVTKDGIKEETLQLRKD